MRRYLPIMKSYEIYNLAVCVIVLIVMVCLFTYLIGSHIRSAIRLTRAGLNDDKIERELKKEIKKHWKTRPGGFRPGDLILSATVCLICSAALCLSLYSRFTQNNMVGAIPTAKVVVSGSMEYKHPANTYLTENGLDNQLQVFDLIVLHQLPPEDELQLYDIVVYETNGYYILHRIVAIEEPNANHPDQKWFLLRGDANKASDDFPVTYEQMRSIYKNEKIPFVGSFVAFMQSPAGMMCFVLILIAMIAIPIADAKLDRAKRERKNYILHGDIRGRRRRK